MPDNPTSTIDARPITTEQTPKDAVRRATRRRVRLLKLSSALCLAAFAWQWQAPSVPYTIVGGLITLAGLAVRGWAVSYMTSHEQPDRSYPDLPMVLMGGPFGLVRHPRYAGTLTIHAGLCVMAGQSPWPLTVTAFALAWWAHLASDRAETACISSRPDAGTASMREFLSLPSFVPAFEWKTFPPRMRRVRTEYPDVVKQRSILTMPFMAHHGSLLILWLAVVGVLAWRAWSIQ